MIPHLAQVLQANLQLAAFSGFHGTTTPLHRAVAAGHLDTCCAILGLIKRRIDAAEDGGAARPRVARPGKGGSAKRWRALHRTVLNQRTNQGHTPLMIACEKG